jgi:Spy/CpxP family protein refolding chaperone
MKSKNAKWAAVAVLVLCGIGILYAQTKGHGCWGPGRRHGFMAHIAHYLQLTDAQQAQIKSMWQAEKPAVQPLLQQLANGRQQMIAATANGAFDQAKVKAIAQQQSETLAQLMVEKEKLQSQIYQQVLTPEQRTKVDAFQQKQTAHIDGWLKRMDTSAPAK